MLITEKILGDLGGWQAMKAARVIFAAGAVEQNERQGDTFRGLVRAGQRKFACTLAVQGPSKADCRCSCPDAQRGLVCAHAIAVALAALQPAASPGPVPAAAPAKVTSAARWQKPPARGRFDVFIPTARLETLGESRGQLPLFLQFQPGGHEDDPVAKWLAEQGMEAQSGPLSLDSKMLADFLNALRGHPRVWDGRPGSPVEHRRRISLAEDGTGNLALHARLQGSDTIAFRMVAGQEAELLALGGQSWIWERDSLRLSPLSESAPDIARLICECFDKNGGGTVRDLRWLARNLDALENALPLVTDEALSHLRLLPAEPRFVIELDGSPRQVTARALAAVGSLRHPVSSQTGADPLIEDLYPVSGAETPLTFFRRNLAREARFRAEVERAGLSATPDGSWTLRGERPVAEFFAVELPKLQRRHEVVLSDRWQAAFRGWKRIAPVVRRSEGNVASPALERSQSHGWLEMEFAYEAADGFRVPRSDIMRLLRSGQSTVPGRQGQTYVLDAESCDDFESLLSESGARLGEGGRVALAPDSGHILNEFAAGGQPLSKLILPDPAEVRRRLGDLAGRLRDYQFEGVRWLIAAAQAGRGALLADDMGLGKTLQVIALLRWLANCEQPIDCEQVPRKATLVICPTSLLSNWSSEIERFAPELHVTIFHGTDRLIHKPINNNFDVILTSYSLAVNDLDIHQASYYQAVVLDEASYVRNPNTAIAKAVCAIGAPVRVALTGTPVENSVNDLWSLMRFVQPGFLGAPKEFADRYAKPLASAATDPAIAERSARRLRTRLAPFVLRRTKKEVVRELPDKIEKVILCDLSVQQKEVYKRLLEEGQAEIRDARRHSAGAGRMTMFTVLLRLRQACNDLRLLGVARHSDVETNTPDALSKADDATAGNRAADEATGGKWPALADIVDDALGGAHKVLIFSQFTGMLRLVRDWLEVRQVGYSYLDGSTRDRGAQVTAFQTDPARRVFLISLKAGGYGLNLTAADHVILVEPWWNPAVEAQAIDRAHRIGQPSVVTASRLIARGTVEERILKLQATKRQFMASAVEDDPLTLPGLTDDDLASLLE